MTLQEAIKEGIEEAKHPYRTKKMSRPDALKLLIEASKVFNDTRLTYDGHPIYLLPGETLD